MSLIIPEAGIMNEQLRLLCQHYFIVNCDDTEMVCKFCGEKRTSMRKEIWKALNLKGKTFRGRVNLNSLAHIKSDYPCQGTFRGHLGLKFNDTGDIYDLDDYR